MAAPTFEVVIAGGRSYIRQPINMVLLVIVPVVFIIAMRSAVSTFSDVLGGNVGEQAGTGLAGLWAASLLAGVAVFFVLRTTLSTDGRLIVAGLSRRALVSAHSITALAIAGVTSSVSLGVLLATQDVASPASLFLAIFISALIYGAMGIGLARLIEGDLEGSFVLILVFMLDAFVGGPLGGAHGPLAGVFPLHFTSEITVSAMVGGGYPADWLLYGLAHLAVLAAVPLAAEARRAAA
jgi:hypothetical protein